MAKVFLGVGHGGNDPGAVGYIKEADVNLNMALACRDYLQANGVQVGMSRTKDENDDLNEEIRECNAYNPDLCVDIHNNAGGGDGAEVYYHHLGGRSKVLAQNIEAEIKAIGQNSRGCKTRLNSKGTADYYGFIRNTKASSVIVEGVFVDNKADAAQADTLEEQKAFGVAIAKGILKTLGITTNNNPTPVQPTPIQPATQLKYKIGDKVRVSSYYASSTDPIEKAVIKNAQGTITRIANGARNPYLLNDGAIGWCNDGDIRGYIETVSYYPACNKNCNSIVDGLNSIGVDSSYNNRKKIAQKNNIHDYKGTASQNSQMLARLKAGRLIRV
jgi:N-acetylmuramoyl-L-alanine amidase